MLQPAISSYLNVGFASAPQQPQLTLTPLVIPESHPPVTIPQSHGVGCPTDRQPGRHRDIHRQRPGRTSDDATTTVQGVAGIPGQTLIGLVNNNILTLIDDVFTGLIGATDNPTLVASLTILKTLTYDAFVMLGVNRGSDQPRHHDHHRTGRWVADECD